MIHTAARFVILCEGAFGSKWRSALSEQLGVSPRAIWNYENGRRAIPEVLWNNVCAALCRRKSEINGLHAEYCEAPCAEHPAQQPVHGS
jgi:hypothetical protein